MPNYPILIKLHKDVIQSCDVNLQSHGALKNKSREQLKSSETALNEIREQLMSSEINLSRKSNVLFLSVCHTS